MEIIKSFDVLQFMYDTSNRETFDCECEICKVQFSLKRITIKRYIDKQFSRILCKSCKCRETKLAYSDEMKQKINNKRMSTNMERYGVENTWQLEKVKENSHNNWEKRKESIRKTMIKKYGVENPMHVEAFKKKMKETSQKKDPGLKRRIIKTKKTNLKRRGHESNFQDKDFHKTSINTQIARYGRPIYSRTYIYNNICFDSSWELAYYIWLTDSKMDFMYQPSVNFKYIGDDGKEHNYYPDFYVMGEYQEIKGNQFFNELGEPYDMINKKYWWEKYNCAKEHNVHILRWNDLMPIMDYVKRTYGKTYLKSFKVKMKKEI